MEKQKFYITTPIYYPSDNLHIGNAYCSVAADTMTRFKKLTGYDAYFLTGTDEHGQKIQRRAQQEGVTPIQYVDKIVAGIKSLWKLMDVEYDDFLRTTEPRHEKAVQDIVQRLYDQGDIYMGEYEGQYCTPCEAFWTRGQLKDGKCPDCGRDVETVKEESYFLRVSKYQDWLIDYYEQNPEFLLPPSRVNEMLNNFLKPGLEDLAISRTTFDWGIPLPFNPRHVVYVWIDALSNYITALNYGTPNDELYKRFWPADVHLIGKEIVRFHAIIWPILLKMLDLPLPKKVFGHGWLVLDGGVKMSKSMGNVVNPVILCDRYGSDAVRYYLMREVPFGSDGQFDNRAMIKRINSDLVNDLGNLVSRATAMTEKYFDCIVPSGDDAGGEAGADLRKRAEGLYNEVERAMDNMQFQVALQEIWKLVGDCNKYIDITKPWTLGKDEQGRKELSAILYNLLECIRIVAVLIKPFMPRTPERIFGTLGISDVEAIKTWESVKSFGHLPSGVRITRGDALFPRIDVEKELEELQSQGAMPGTKEAKPKSDQPKPETPPESQDTQGIISIDDFAKVKLRTGKVINCEAVPKADKLLKLTVKVGEDTRTVVSGIAKWYTPEEVIGKTVTLVANLKPTKLRGILSEGMILCASDEAGNLRIITTDGEIADGSEVR